jgi:enterochelin esterase family protein
VSIASQGDSKPFSPLNTPHLHPELSSRCARVEDAEDAAAIHDPRFRGLGIDPTGFGHPEFDNTAGRANERKGHPLNATVDTPDLSAPGVHPYTRDVTVYVPAAARAPGPAAPFIIVNDGVSYVDVMVPVLDALIAECRVPSNLVAIFANSGGSDAQASQRGLEYDTVDGTFARYCDLEVVPFVEKQSGISLTRDPSGRAAMGGSSGGCAAFGMAWFRPDLFRRVLTYSGTYVNQQYPFNECTPTGFWELHANKLLIANAPTKPIKVILFNTELDIGYDLPESTLHNWTRANTRMAATLKGKGYG